MKISIPCHFLIVSISEYHFLLNHNRKYSIPSLPLDENHRQTWEIVSISTSLSSP